jgi:alpha-beta hydrolase superfamily lysophospholipase
MTLAIDSVGYACIVPEASVTALDGILLAVEDHELPSAHARVLIVHGYGEHRARYAHVVSRLAREGFECHLFDLRGHGHSGGTIAHVEHFQDYLDDLTLVVRHVSAIGPSTLPLFLISHSLGGLIALSYVRGAGAGVDALAVSDPYLHPAFRIPFARKALAAILSRVLPKMVFDNGLDAKWLSHDPEVVRAYASDPLVHKTTTPRWYTEVTRAQRELIAGADGIRLPLLMQIGEGDRIADHQVSLDVFKRTGSVDKTLLRYPGLFHEIFNELEREAVIDDLVAWLRKAANGR